MKPVDFAYVRPTSLQEALSALVQEEDAKVLAGGQSLVPMMNFRLATPSLVVDINGLPDLSGIERAGNGISIGALTRQAAVERSETVRQRCPLLAEALTYVSHPQLRSRGTVVGSLVHHDPSAELPAVALALGARISLAGPAGLRTVAAKDFFLSHFTANVGEHEIATEVWFPETGPGTGSAFVEIARRPGDFAMVGVATVVAVQDDVVTSAALSVAGVAEHPVRCASAESFLMGRAPTADVFADAADLAATDDTVRPADDVHATASYRRRALRVLTEQALGTAAGRASSTTTGGGA